MGGRSAIDERDRPSPPRKRNHPALALWLLIACSAAFGATPSQDVQELAGRGRALYTERCATCHDHPQGRIPPRILIATVRAPEDIVAALTSGAMRPQAAGLGEQDVRALAAFLTGRLPSEDRRDPNANPCGATQASLVPGAADWNGWGRDQANTRFHPHSGLAADDLPRLKLKWVFAYPGSRIYGQPVVVGGRIFIGGNSAGRVYSLDTRTGCTHWSYQAEGFVRTAVVVGPAGAGPGARLAAFFGGDRAMVHAVDAQTGAPLWATRVDEYPLAHVLGTPKLHEGRLYVPVSSTESSAAADPDYPCCSFRGKVVALDAATGRTLWRSAAIEGPLAPGRLKENGERISGPAGAAMFASPAIDAKRGVLYVGTGNSYTNRRETGSDAIHAFDLVSGRPRWSRQVLGTDAWVGGCAGNEPRGNCPVPLGPDFGFASSPILVEQAAGGPVLLAPSKSGILYALDPDARGRLRWQTELVRGDLNGGILWGPAVAGDRVFVATSKYDYISGEGSGALAAVAIDTGRLLWRTPSPARPCTWGSARCAQAQLAAVTAIPGAVFAGSLDGRIRAYASDTGRILWEFNTGDVFDAVNGGQATGGGIDYGGQTVADGMLFVQSGSGRQPGNALLAFSAD